MNENGCAFPVQYDDGSYQQGMTLRDYFAAKAMQGMLDPVWVKSASDMVEDADEIRLFIANTAYEYADAMLKAREEK